jgi:hypothetical protein
MSPEYENFVKSMGVFYLITIACNTLNNLLERKPGVAATQVKPEEK